MTPERTVTPSLLQIRRYSTKTPTTASSSGSVQRYDDEWLDYISKIKNVVNVPVIELEKMITDKIAGRGGHATVELQRQFRISDLSRSGKVDFNGFRRGIVTFGVLMSKEQAALLFEKHVGQDGLVDYLSFIRKLVPPDYSGAGGTQSIGSGGLQKHEMELINKRQAMAGKVSHLPRDADPGELLVQVIERRAGSHNFLNHAFQLFKCEKGVGIRLPDFRAAVAKCNLPFTEQQVLELFSRYDRLGTGCIDFYEFVSGLMKAAGGAHNRLGASAMPSERQQARSLASKMVKGSRKNRRKKATTMELRTFLLEVGGGALELLCAFRRADPSASSRIRFEGFTRALDDLAEYFPAAHLRRLFDEYDYDGVGTIDYQEFVAQPPRGRLRKDGDEDLMGLGGTGDAEPLAEGEEKPKKPAGISSRPKMPVGPTLEEVYGDMLYCEGEDGNGGETWKRDDVGSRDRSEGGGGGGGGLEGMPVLGGGEEGVEGRKMESGAGGRNSISLGRSAKPLPLPTRLRGSNAAEALEQARNIQEQQQQQRQKQQRRRKAGRLSHGGGGVHQPRKTLGGSKSAPQLEPISSAFSGEQKQQRRSPQQEEALASLISRSLHMWRALRKSCAALDPRNTHILTPADFAMAYKLAGVHVEKQEILAAAARDSSGRLLVRYDDFFRRLLTSEPQGGGGG